MGKFDGILLCTDLDGTLLRNDKSISPENRAAIAYFKREGGYFTFVTGRMPSYVWDMYRTVQPNAPVGCVNGGGLYDYENERYLWTHGLSRDVMELVDYVDTHMPTMGIQLNTFDTVYFCKESSALSDFRAETGVPNIVRPYREVPDPIAKILFADRDGDEITRLAALLSAHSRAGEFDFIRSDLTLYEILPRGIHKGVSLSKLSEILGIDPRRTVAVGDYDNDIGMLRTAGLGVAVANATEAVKAAADMITVSNEQHAIAAVIDHIEKNGLPVPRCASNCEKM
jgi:Cof subfamily protein (haloacid dehalogenase superfamily)